MTLQIRNSMRRYLRLSSICVSLALTTSCFPKLLVSELPQAQNVQEQTATFESAAVQTNADESGSAEPRTFTFTLGVGKRQLSGIMLAKPVEEGSWRVVGTTYFGMTLFDMTVSRDSYVTNYVAEAMSRDAFSAFLASKLRKSLSM